MAKNQAPATSITVLGTKVPVITIIGAGFTLLYLFVISAASGFIAGIAAIGLVAAITALYTVISGRKSWAMIPSRKIAGLVLGAALLLTFVSAGIGVATSPRKAEPVVVETQTPTPVATKKATKTATPTPKATKTSTPTATRTPTPTPTPTPTVAPVVEAPAPIEPAPVAPAEPVFYYANCTAVRAAGAAPIHAGDYGYSTKLDRDGDGIACE